MTIEIMRHSNWGKRPLRLMLEQEDDGSVVVLGLMDGQEPTVMVKFMENDQGTFFMSADKRAAGNIGVYEPSNVTFSKGG